jgi:glycosyltransferase involved in cell wall biosynthesis
VERFFLKGKTHMVAPEMALSVVIPVYNEQNSILTVVASLDQTLAALGLPYEIILVDDGSTDQTSQKIRELPARFPHLVTLTHEENRGYGAALKTGISRSAFDRIMIIDADQTYTVDEIPRLVEAAKSFDMVVGSRTGTGVRIPLIRRPAKFIMKRLAEFLVGRKIPDINSGCRIFKKEIFARFYRMFPDGFSFTSTLTLISLSRGYTVQYIPIQYLQREGKSKIRPIRDTFNFLQLICRTVLYVNPMKIFFPASLIFLEISIILYIYRVVFGRGFLVSIILTFICGFQLLVIGLLADLIDKRMQ